MWLVDVDHVPRYDGALRALVRFESRDHFGPSDDSPIAVKIRGYLADHGVDAEAATIYMLTGARVLGYAFDPITVYWVFIDGTQQCAVAEVHNTYGERTAYLLQTDGAGAATIEKDFYVSPFYEVTGSYAVRLRLDAERVGVAITYHPDGSSEPFTATFAGSAQAATRQRIVRAQLRFPLVPQRTTALITAHGLWLWLRRVPVRTRPQRQPSKWFR